MTFTEHQFRKFTSTAAAFLFVAGIAVSHTVKADISGLYVAPWIGSADYSDFQGRCQDALDSLNLIGSTIGPISSDCEVDDSHSAFGVGLGWRFNGVVALEAGYTDLGKLSADIGVSTGAATANNNLSVSVSGVSLSLLLGFPLAGKGSLFGRIGAFNGDADADVRIRDPRTGETFSAEISDDGTQGFAGVGVDYYWSENVGGRLEYDKYDLSQDVEVISAGLLFKF